MKLLIILDKTYNYSGDPKPYKWQLWIQGIGFIASGSHVSRIDAINDANDRWRSIKELIPEFVDNTK